MNPSAVYWKNWTNSKKNLTKEVRSRTMQDWKKISYFTSARCKSLQRKNSGVQLYITSPVQATVSIQDCRCKYTSSCHDLKYVTAIKNLPVQSNFQLDTLKDWDIDCIIIVSVKQTKLRYVQWVLINSFSFECFSCPQILAMMTESICLKKNKTPFNGYIS